MAETIRAFAGVRDVTFTPDGDSARPVGFLDQVDEDVRVEQIAHTNADGIHDVFAYTTRLWRQVTVRSKDLTALAKMTFPVESGTPPTLAVNAVGTLSWTLVGKGVAVDTTISARARVVRPVAYGSGDGAEPVVGSVVFHLLSSDGTTDPTEDGS